MTAKVKGVVSDMTERQRLIKLANVFGAHYGWANEQCDAGVRGDCEACATEQHLRLLLRPYAVVNNES